MVAEPVRPDVKWRGPGTSPRAAQRHSQKGKAGRGGNRVRFLIMLRKNWNDDKYRFSHESPQAERRQFNKFSAAAVAKRSLSTSARGYRGARCATKEPRKS